MVRSYATRIKKAIEFVFFFLSSSSTPQFALRSRPSLFHLSSCPAFLFPTWQRSIEVIKFRATQSPRLISHVHRSSVFQLLPIGSRYYTGARRPPGGRLSLNRLRNDVKSLQLAAIGRTHGTGEKMRGGAKNETRG